MIKYNDNRNFFRMLVNTNIELEITDADAGRKLNAICRDLSATGLAIEADEYIEVGTSLICRVAGTSPELPALNASASVVRCTKEDSGNYTIGVEILEHM